VGSLYKRGKVWYLDFRYKGRRIRRRVGTSKKVAELALKDVEVKAARDELGFTRNDLPLATFIHMFLEYSGANHRPKTTTRYRKPCRSIAFSAHAGMNRRALPTFPFLLGQ